MGRGSFDQNTRLDKLLRSLNYEPIKASKYGDGLILTPFQSIVKVYLEIFATKV
jgi:hypothetical protein